VSVVDLSVPYATHLSLGVQREIAANLVVTADFVYRLFIHNPIQADYNHFNRAPSLGGPDIPRCTTEAQRRDPKALCSTGTINAFTSAGRAKYKGLLVRIEKRFSRHHQLLASYAYSSNIGLNNGPGNFFVLNNADWFESYGPLDRDIRHILNL